MRKAISPLVAAVLLIAVTMTLAGILAYWASSFVRTRVEEWEENVPLSDCTFAMFRIYSCSYSDTDSKINLILENTRSIELKNLTTYVFYPNNTIDTQSLGETLPANTIKAFSISGVGSDFSELVVKTECPDLSADSSCR